MLRNILYLKRSKLSKKVWLHLNELKHYFRLTIWITGCASRKPSFDLLRSRIKRLIEKSGWDFTFLYLKEVLRLVIRFLAGSPEPNTVTKVLVKKDHLGLPTIIPSTLRLIITDWKKNRMIIVCILGCLSVFRVFPTKVKPKLGTIIDPFSGTTRTFDSSKLKLALREIHKGTLSIHKPKLIKLESAGPNTVKSAWGSSLDALAFLENPRTLMNLIIYHYYYGKLWVPIWIIFLVILVAPLFLILRTTGHLDKVLLGRLSVVYDQAGKARVIAVTNWWLQMTLKPLHNSILKILSKLDEDGTFDQHGPLNKLIEKVPRGTMFHSFDLSAATDRLPLDIQRDILNILLPNLGHSWSNLLDFKWFYKGNLYKYSVGQPMGAYSSWAMLALTHHVIVKLAAHNVGVRKFTDYCILGDDIVIANDTVAKEYYNLMTLLGVSINLSKSVQSYDFAEFAKVWRGPEVDLTPIGPGLTLRLIRDKKFLAVYLAEAWKLKIISSFHDILGYVTTFRSDKNLRTECNNILWSSFGLNSFTNADKSHIDANAIMWCFSARVEELPLMRYHIYNALLQLKIEDKHKASKKLEQEISFFCENWWKTFSGKSRPLRLLEALLKIVGPGFWIYAYSFEESKEALKSIALLNEDANWTSIFNLAKSDLAINVSSIDWRQKQQVKEQSLRMRNFYREYDRSFSEYTTEMWMLENM